MSSHTIYSLRAPDVIQALDTTPQGLSQTEVQARLGLYGHNRLPDPPQSSELRGSRRLIAHLTYPLALLLWGGGILATAIGKLELAGIIWSIVVINAIFSYWQEHRAERTVIELSHFLPSQTRIVRDGQETLIPASEVVPGDILVLGQGDNVPADARVIEQYGLRANQATLTGEAIAVVKTAEASLRDGLSDLERPNLLFAGTSIVAGTGRAVVYATGAMTEFGRIARLSEQGSEGPSELQKDITRLARIIAIIAVGLGAVIFVVASTQVGFPVIEAFILSIGMIIAVVPEGLRPTLTLTLAIAVQRLARRGVLVKKLAMLETLGTISVICTDKSGTLTQNQMTVRELWLGGRRVSVSGVGYEPVGEFTPEPASNGPMGEFEMFLNVAYLCNNARLISPGSESPSWKALGDQTEAALRALALKGNPDIAAMSGAYPRLHELPFDATRKRMTTIHRTADGEIAFSKGAPREMLSACTHILLGGKICLLDDTLRSEIMAANDDYARRALRVLGLAYRQLPAREGAYTNLNVERSLVFIGLAAMMDPPRPDVAHSMHIFREAGVRLIMITGDYGLTAESLARRVGMLQSERPRILTGGDLSAMSDEEINAALDEEVIFARVAPEQKLKVVAALQHRGETVAFSGDGVNDAPALRKADVGIAMGITGTDVAREAADIILTQDRFGDITFAIEEGRAIYENIRKFLTYILASNVPEVMPFLLTALFNVPLALGVAEILAIDLGTDLLPALALGIEQPEPETMQGPPRSRRRSLVDNALLARALWLGGLETLLCYVGFYLIYALATPSSLTWLPGIVGVNREFYLSLGPDRLSQVAVTVFFAGVIMTQIGSAIAARSERVGVRRLGLFRNSFLWAGILGEIAVALILIYGGPLDHVFLFVPYTPAIWIILGSFTLAVYMLDRVRKVIWQRCKIIARKETEST